MAGRPRNIESPEKLWSLFQEYVADLKEKENDWLKVQYVGKEATRVQDAFKLPLTIEGFKRYCWDIEIGCIDHYLKNTNNEYEEFCLICSRIKNTIRENQIIGGVIGVFNPSITQRLNNIHENIKTEHSGEIKGISLSTLSTKELAERAKAVKKIDE